MRLLAVLIVVLAAAGAASAATSITFRTPTGNIGCAFMSGGGLEPNLRCDIRSGIRPKPPRPRVCSHDWGFSYAMAPTGTARALCAGDTVIRPMAKVLAYGKTWSHVGFTCTSRVPGVRCTNRSGHGFFLSRARSYRF
jgi:hypothetical protein